jgi:hypothetical protein
LTTYIFRDRKNGPYTVEDIQVKASSESEAWTVLSLDVKIPLQELKKNLWLMEGID